MSFFFRRSEAVRGAVRGYLLALLVVALVPALLWADAPTWWVEQGVLNTAPGVVVDDYAVVNQGQVKHIAKQAYVEMQAKLPSGAGSAITGMVTNWDASGAGTDDYQAINIGQLKNVAKPFYDRLAIAYPWLDSVNPADDYALANIGQVKNLFSFIVPGAPIDPNDTDADGLLDSWELQYWPNLSHGASEDYDSDGVDNLTEYRQGRNPIKGAVSDASGVVGLRVFSPAL